MIFSISVPSDHFNQAYSILKIFALGLQNSLECGIPFLYTHLRFIGSAVTFKSLALEGSSHPPTLCISIFPQLTGNCRDPLFFRALFRRCLCCTNGCQKNGVTFLKSALLFLVFTLIRLFSFGEISFQSLFIQNEFVDILSLDTNLVEVKPVLICIGHFVNNSVTCLVSEKKKQRSTFSGNSMASVSLLKVMFSG